MNKQQDRSEFVKEQLNRLAARMGGDAPGPKSEAQIENCGAKYAGKPIPIRTKAMADYLAGLSAELREPIEESA